MPVDPRRGERRASARRCASAVAVLALSAAALYGCGDASAPAPQAQRIVIRTGSPKGKPISEQKPPRPHHLDVASRAQERTARSAPKVKFVRGDPSKMPAASAGTNGSFAPPAGGARKSMNAHTMAGVGNLPASRSAILLHGVALAPPSAPDAVKRAISAANQIVGTPLRLGRRALVLAVAAATTARARSATRSPAAASCPRRSPRASSSHGARRGPAAGSPSTRTPATPTP